MSQGGFAAFPVCRECNAGELVPLSDFGSQGASVLYKAWVCTNPECGFNVKIRNGEVMMNEPITDARDARPEPRGPRGGTPQGGLRPVR